MPDVTHHKPYRRKLRSAREKNFKGSYFPLNGAVATSTAKPCGADREAVAFHPRRYRVRDFEAVLHSLEPKGNINAGAPINADAPIDVRPRARRAAIHLLFSGAVRITILTQAVL